MSDARLILVGGGLANCLIALRLAEAQPDLEFLLLERDERLGGNHTWSYHGSDLTPAQLNWLAPLTEYHWEGYDVRFPNLTRALPGTYHSMTSEKLHSYVVGKLGDRVRTGTPVADVTPASVTLEDGTALTAASIIDGRGPRASAHLDVRFQKFVGRIVQTAGPHGLTRPIIMDATITQDDGYRFFYTLPFDERTLLIEDTRYSDAPGISSAEYGDEISEYAARRGWHIESVLREEDGVLPITLGGNIEKFWDEQPLARSGLAAALFHPATGYSLPNAVRLADELAAQRDWSATGVYHATRHHSTRLWQTTGFYRVLNRMLFLAADDAERRHVLERFYRFTTRADRAFLCRQIHVFRQTTDT